MPAARTQPVDVRERTLREATRLFAARGFDATSLQEIADAVGVRKPSLLYHFPSKAALRESVLSVLLDRWNDVLPRLLVSATSPEQQFDSVIEETVRFLGDDADRARLLLREVLDRPQDMGALIGEHVRPWVDVVCDYIRKGKRRGTVHPDVDPEAYVVNCISLVLCNIATHDCLSAMGAAVFDNHIKELVRIAKASLFLPTATARATERANGSENEDDHG